MSHSKLETKIKLEILLGSQSREIRRIVAEIKTETIETSFRKLIFSEKISNKELSIVFDIYAQYLQENALDLEFAIELLNFKFRRTEKDIEICILSYFKNMDAIRAKITQNEFKVRNLNNKMKQTRFMAQNVNLTDDCISDKNINKYEPDSYKLKHLNATDLIAYNKRNKNMTIQNEELFIEEYFNRLYGAIVKKISRTHILKEIYSFFENLLEDKPIFIDIFIREKYYEGFLFINEFINRFYLLFNEYQSVEIFSYTQAQYHKNLLVMLKPFNKYMLVLDSEAVYYGFNIFFLFLMYDCDVFFENKADAYLKLNKDKFVKEINSFIDCYKKDKFKSIQVKNKNSFDYLKSPKLKDLGSNHESAVKFNIQKPSNINSSCYFTHLHNKFDHITGLKTGILLSVHRFNEFGDIKLLQTFFPNPFIFLRYSHLIDLKSLGEFIGKEKNKEYLNMFISTFNFKNKNVLEGLRDFLRSFVLPGESQVIVRILEEFSIKFYKDKCCDQETVKKNLDKETTPELEEVDNTIENRGSQNTSDKDMYGNVYKNMQTHEIDNLKAKEVSNFAVIEDIVYLETDQNIDFNSWESHEPNPTKYTKKDIYILVYSLIILNTNLHNPNVKVKMNRTTFKENNKKCQLSPVFEDKYLDFLFYDIKKSPIKFVQKNLCSYENFILYKTLIDNIENEPAHKLYEMYKNVNDSGIINGENTKEKYLDDKHISRDGNLLTNYNSDGFNGAINEDKYIENNFKQNKGYKIKEDKIVNRENCMKNNDQNDGKGYKIKEDYIVNNDDCIQNSHQCVSNRIDENKEINSEIYNQSIYQDGGNIKAACLEKKVCSSTNLCEDERNISSDFHGKRVNNYQKGNHRKRYEMLGKDIQDSICIYCKIYSLKSIITRNSAFIFSTFFTDLKLIDLDSVKSYLKLGYILNLNIFCMNICNQLYKNISGQFFEDFFDIYFETLSFCVNNESILRDRKKQNDELEVVDLHSKSNDKDFNQSLESKIDEINIDVMDNTADINSDNISAIISEKLIVDNNNLAEELPAIDNNNQLKNRDSHNKTSNEINKEGSIVDTKKEKVKNKLHTGKNNKKLKKEIFKLKDFFRLPFLCLNKLIDYEETERKSIFKREKSIYIDKKRIINRFVRNTASINEAMFVAIFKEGLLFLDENPILDEIICEVLLKNCFRVKLLLETNIVRFLVGRADFIYEFIQKIIDLDLKAEFKGLVHILDILNVKIDYILFDIAKEKNDFIDNNVLEVFLEILLAHQTQAYFNILLCLSNTRDLFEIICGRYLDYYLERIKHNKMEDNTDNNKKEENNIKDDKIEADYINKDYMNEDKIKENNTIEAKNLILENRINEKDHNEDKELEYFSPFLNDPQNLIRFYMSSKSLLSYKFIAKKIIILTKKSEAAEDLQKEAREIEIDASNDNYNNIQNNCILKDTEFINSLYRKLTYILIKDTLLQNQDLNEYTTEIFAVLFRVPFLTLQFLRDNFYILDIVANQTAKSLIKIIISLVRKIINCRNNCTCKINHEFMKITDYIVNEILERGLVKPKYLEFYASYREMINLSKLNCEKTGQVNVIDQESAINGGVITENGVKNNNNYQQFGANTGSECNSKLDNELCKYDENNKNVNENNYVLDDGNKLEMGSEISDYENKNLGKIENSNSNKKIDSETCESDNKKKSITNDDENKQIYSEIGENKENNNKVFKIEEIYKQIDSDINDDKLNDASCYDVNLTIYNDSKVSIVDDLLSEISNQKDLNEASPNGINSIEESEKISDAEFKNDSSKDHENERVYEL